ncbi:MAG: DUF6288 domain-containing protein [Planctomycetota bacterium]|nr:DUF6288 domain-containing protein [Planctomycetota bacterium]
MNQDLSNTRSWWLSIAVTLLVACGAGVEAFAAATEKARPEYPWIIGPQNGLDAQTGGHWFNLGPTGVRAKIAAGEPREFIVKYVFADSPADKRILVDDKIVGVNGRKFKDPELFSAGFAGPRMELGKAIEESEGDTALNGKLTFMVVRDGKSMDAAIQLRNLGYFSKNFPFECKKSEILIKEACEWLTKPVELKLKPGISKYKPGIYINGHWHTQIACKLALMAQGETYMPLLKEHYKRRAETDDGKGASEYTAKGDGMWVYCEALQMIELAEWYMLTKDKTVPAPLKYHESVVCYCQHPNGGFEHGKVKNIYPTMAFPAGLACVGWALMKQAGLEINNEAYMRSRNGLMWSTQASGEIWYDITPVPKTPYTPPAQFDVKAASRRDQGVSGRGALATLMQFLDPMDSCSDSYVRRGVAHLAACADMLMEGHASAALNAQWEFTAMGIAPLIGDMKSYRETMDYYKYWFNLNRCYDGSFYAPACTAGEIDPYQDVHYITTGWVILALSAPKRSLGILGRDRLIPGLDKTALSPSLLQLYDTIRTGRGNPAATLQSIISLKKTAKEKDLAALEMLEAFVTKPMFEKLAKLEELEKSGDVFQLEKELKILRTSFGPLDSFKEKTSRYEEELRKEPWMTEVKLGASYQQLMEALKRNKSAAYAADLEKFAEKHPDSIYGKRAREVADEFRSSGGIKEPAPGNAAPSASATTVAAMSTARPATKDAAAKPAAATAKPLAVSSEALEQWQVRFVKKLDSLAKGGAKVKYFMESSEGYVVVGANGKSLIVNVQGNILPLPWKQVSSDARAAMAKEAAKDGDVEALIIAAVFQLAGGNSVEADELFTKASLKDTEAVKAAKAELAGDRP